MPHPKLLISKMRLPARRWRRWLVKALALICIIMVSASCGLGLIIYRYGQIDHADNSDAIIVLGAGSRRVIQRRAAHGAYLWEQGLASNLLCTGGFTAGRRRSEAETCRTTLINLGVPEEVIFMEEESRSTEENVFFTAKIMAEQAFTSAIIVSDDYHLWRAHLIFRETFEPKGWLVVTSPAQTTQANSGWNRKAPALVREVAATYWHVGKDALGLPFTNFPG